MKLIGVKWDFEYIVVYFDTYLDVRQISVGDLATIAERWNLEHESNFYFLIFFCLFLRLQRLYQYAR